MEKLLRELDGRLCLARRITQKNRYAGTLLAFGPFIWRDALHHHAPVELTGLASDGHALGHGDALQPGREQGIADQTLQPAIVIGIDGLERTVVDPYSIAHVQNGGGCWVGLDQLPRLIENDHAHHQLRSGTPV